ncbi:asparagine synthase-related protein [Carboxylicivirga linearis]|uniref:asparagine synthase (glutamine-hydrolyzing) n=1 Tax=Carboxylicivirga linearis TaxID=1628157 RepID=A0ABS5JVZ4_9BACT|nr:asparagine synthase-related protein [Carboxylicivirga linearis]MBS2099077.1 asparagine synthetase B family protein [Carboxylicivirga linearis]
MITKRTAIIPDIPQFVGIKDELDYKSICFFAATNFFLGENTYYKKLKCLLPGTEYTLSDNNEVLEQKRWFDWHYSPRDIRLDEVVDEFSHLFKTITEEQTQGRRVVLPLSGGLDSRTQAAVLKGHPNVSCYSYEYPNGIKEASFGQKIASACGYDFTRMVTPEGYLWEKLDEITSLMQYGGDSTASRQAAFMDDFPLMGDTLFLGHWGDVLFDDMGLDSNRNYSDEDYIDIMIHKLSKRGGVELANDLWQAFGLSGSFMAYFNEQVGERLADINITDPNAKIRAFKSLYWAPRWTSMAMPIFAKNMEIKLPYYDDRMCKFICTIPEKHLAGRQVQIEYLKKEAPELARIPWQTFAPLNLYTYKRYNHISNLPNRIMTRLRYDYNRLVKPKGFVTRNWEIQFLGTSNQQQLAYWLDNNKKLNKFIPKELTNKYFQAFKKGKCVGNAHPISTLLTFSAFVNGNL